MLGPRIIDTVVAMPLGLMLSRLMIAILGDYGFYRTAAVHYILVAVPPKTMTPAFLFWSTEENLSDPRCAPPHNGYHHMFTLEVMRSLRERLDNMRAGVSHLRTNGAQEHPLALCWKLNATVAPRLLWLD
ncbi:hypothetical protein TNCV_1649771 [Trichonephila clavipes]|nr:hypothetical protein TNCV_1649771 [Trichonephila clavipes]